MFKRIKGRYMALIAGLLGMLPSLALADELSAGDTAWMLTATVLVLFMTIPGLSLFYAGMVRSKNVLSVMMQCFAITALMTVLWVIYGYNLAFGDGGQSAGAEHSQTRRIDSEIETELDRLERIDLIRLLLLIGHHGVDLQKRRLVVQDERRLPAVVVAQLDCSAFAPDGMLFHNSYRVAD